MRINIETEGRFEEKNVEKLSELIEVLEALRKEWGDCSIGDDRYIMDLYISSSGVVEDDPNLEISTDFDVVLNSMMIMDEMREEEAPLDTLKEGGEHHE